MNKVTGKKIRAIILATALTLAANYGISSALESGATGTVQTPRPSFIESGATGTVQTPRPSFIESGATGTVQTPRPAI